MTARCHESPWEIQSAAGSAHSKTWRKCARLWPTRQRFGVRRTSAAFNESEQAEPVRFTESHRNIRAFWNVQLSEMNCDHVNRIWPRRFMKTRHGRAPAGFTLIELLVTIAIIAILAALLLPALSAASATRAGQLFRKPDRCAHARRTRLALAGDVISCSVVG